MTHRHRHWRCLRAYRECKYNPDGGGSRTCSPRTCSTRRYPVCKRGRWLRPGNLIASGITELGRQENRCAAEPGRTWPSCRRPRENRPGAWPNWTAGASRRWMRPASTSRRLSTPAASGVLSRWQAADLERLEPDRLELPEHSVQRGLATGRPACCRSGVHNVSWPLPRRKRRRSVRPGLSATNSRINFRRSPVTGAGTTRHGRSENRRS